jgi:HEPN domain-containing protein
MREPDAAALTVAREWVEKAENDLTTAAHTLKLEAKQPTDTICFHAQQCVEKYLKALLVTESIAFPKTHSIRVLMELLPVGLRPALDLPSQDRLTEYATVTRYPGDYEEIPTDEARGAVALARRVRREVRKALPGPVLRKARK